MFFISILTMSTLHGVAHASPPFYDLKLAFASVYGSEARPQVGTQASLYVLIKNVHKAAPASTLYLGVSSTLSGAVEPYTVSIGAMNAGSSRAYQIKMPFRWRPAEYTFGLMAAAQVRRDDHGNPDVSVSARDTDPANNTYLVTALPYSKKFDLALTDLALDPFTNIGPTCCGRMACAKRRSKKIFGTYPSFRRSSLLHP